MNEKTVDRIMAGSLTDLPGVSSKVVRIFTSSTFTDMLMERNTLMEFVYPKIKEYCREKHGLEFQVVDMRWGVRDEMTNEHQTTELCMTELINCQRLSMGPNFIYFGAQKYGYRPIPTYVVSSELAQLREVLVTMGNDVSLLDKWYRTDFNAVPNISILLPIDTHLVHFLNKRVPKLQARDSGIWWGTLGKMQLMLRKASNTLYLNGKMTFEQMHNYRMAVTEREVINGCLSVGPKHKYCNNVKDHVIIYTRIINNINLQNLKRASAFIDIADRKVDEEAVGLLAHYRDVLLPKKMKDNNAIYKKYFVEWIGREGLASETHEEFLTDFINHFYKNVLKLVDRAMRKEDTSAQGKIVTEILLHLHACINSVKVFYGRIDELARLKEYITGESNTPFVLYGAGGSGKTAMVSMAASKSLQEWLKPAVPLLLVRYCGTTPNSSQLGPLLRSLCQQISYVCMLPFEDIPNDIVPLTAHMKELLNHATADRPFIICLDSIDELGGSQDSNKMSWLPTKLPPHCKIVLSCTREDNNPALCNDYKFLCMMIDAKENFLEVTPLGKEMAWKVIKLWMKTAGRDLNNYQWRVVANAVVDCSLPIFCQLVFREICRWTCYAKPEDTYLCHNVMDSIFLLLQKVENKHGWLLVSHALSYVTASKNGVSEPEIEDLISLDDKVLDDIYQYHLPPFRRIPPLLWTRVRSDLPGYLSDSEADGVCVINWYHRQFKVAAKERYFKTDEDYLYFHSYMSDFFLGRYGGGIPKAFRFTEIQKHRFNLKCKDSEADRQVPAMPLVFYTKEGKISRYNLRKFGELPYQLVRCRQFEGKLGLFENVLFNYQWLYAKMSACPLQSVLGDFEDAWIHLKDENAKREISLVADSLRLGGAILGQYPDMLAPQLVGRLLSELDGNKNLKALLRQCDEEGLVQNALVPTFHCMHTPGGPLKYSLEGHQFAVFAFRLTPDFRYIVSVSNKFITWDVSTSDLARIVYPEVEGLMMDIEISPDNKYVAAYTNNSQTILLNTLVSEFVIIDSPLKADESVQGICMLDSNLVIYGQSSWVFYDMNGTQVDTFETIRDEPIVKMEMRNAEDFSVIHWSGDDKNPHMAVATYKSGGLSPVVEFHSVIALNKEQNICWLCHREGSYDVTMYKMYDIRQGVWMWCRERDYPKNEHKLLELSCSHDEKFVIATHKLGFILWHIETVNADPSGEVGCTHLKLPNGVRNVSVRANKSSPIVLSAKQEFAIAGIRKEMYVWSVKTGELVKTLDAHFSRIIDVQPLTYGQWNCVITSSIDRCIKIWNMNYIFQKSHHIDRHELPIESVKVSTEAGIAVTVTRNCLGIWDLLTGKLQNKLSDSSMGAIITHAEVIASGKYIVAIESGYVLYWNVPKSEVVFKEEQRNALQILLYDEDKKCVFVSKEGMVGDMKAVCTVRTVPEGETLFEFEFYFKKFMNIFITKDQQYFITYGLDKFKDSLFAFSVETGELVHIILIKYPNFKEITMMCGLPDKPWQVALIDADKGNIMDIREKRYVRAIPLWGGAMNSTGKYGIFAPSKGGLDLLDLRHGTVWKTLIPKIAEGIFNVICKFNATNEYVLYYHSGRKTVRVFRVKDGTMIANYRVPSDLSSLESTTDGISLVLGMVDGNLTVLTIADPKKERMSDYLKALPSRNQGQNLLKEAGF